jgi:hypothetical protein
MAASLGLPACPAIDSVSPVACEECLQLVAEGCAPLLLANHAHNRSAPARHLRLHLDVNEVGARGDDYGIQLSLGESASKEPSRLRPERIRTELSSALLEDESVRVEEVPDEVCDLTCTVRTGAPHATKTVCAGKNVGGTSIPTS